MAGRMACYGGGEVHIGFCCDFWGNETAWKNRRRLEDNIKMDR